MRVLHLLPIGGVELGVGIFFGLTTGVLAIIETGDADAATASGVATAVKVSLAIWLSLFLSLKLLYFIARKFAAIKERSEKISEHGSHLKPSPALIPYQILGSITIFSIYAIPVTIAILIWSSLGLLVRSSGVLDSPIYWSIPFWLGIFSFSLIILFSISTIIGFFILWTEHQLHVLENRPEKAIFRTTSFVSRLARVELST